MITINHVKLRVLCYRIIIILIVPQAYFHSGNGVKIAGTYTFLHMKRRRNNVLLSRSTNFHKPNPISIR